MIPKIANSRNLALLGETGCGKTQLATEIVAFELERKNTVVYIQKRLPHSNHIYIPREVESQTVPITIVEQPCQISTNLDRGGLIYNFVPNIPVGDVFFQIKTSVSIFSEKSAAKNTRKPLVVFDEPSCLPYDLLSKLLTEIQQLPVKILVIAQSPACIDTRPVYESGWRKYFNNSLWKHFDSKIGRVSPSERVEYEQIFPKMCNQTWQNLLPVKDTGYQWLSDRRYKLEPPGEAFDYSTNSSATGRIVNELSQFIL